MIHLDRHWSPTCLEVMVPARRRSKRSGSSLLTPPCCLKWSTCAWSRGRYVHETKRGVVVRTQLRTSRADRRTRGTRGGGRPTGEDSDGVLQSKWPGEMVINGNHLILCSAFRPWHQSSVLQAKEFLEAVTTASYFKDSATFVIENHLEEVFEGGCIEKSSVSILLYNKGLNYDCDVPTQLPEILRGVVDSLCGGDSVCGKPPVKCWALKVCDGVEISGLLHEAIVMPALSLLSAENKTKVGTCVWNVLC